LLILARHECSNGAATRTCNCEHPQGAHEQKLCFCRKSRSMAVNGGGVLPPLQGGGRWFELSIAHVQNPCKRAIFCGQGERAGLRFPALLLQPYCNPTRTSRNPLDKAGSEMIEDTRKRTCWPDTLVWSGAGWFILVMSRSGFESARWLSTIGLDKPYGRNRKSLRFVLGKLPNATFTSPRTQHSATDGRLGAAGLPRGGAAGFAR